MIIGPTLCDITDMLQTITYYAVIIMMISRQCLSCHYPALPLHGSEE